MSFISRYLEHTKIYESPLSFWKFSSYAAISAVLRDNVWKKQGDKYLYANIYTLLLADSAVQRKGNPIELCEKLVKAVGNTKIISGRTSIQAVFDVLGMAETDKKTGQIRKGGSAIFFAPELAAGVVKDEQSVSILTNIYDFKEDYRDHLRGKGITDVEKVVFSFFAGSNETLMRQVYGQDAIYGGLLGRTLIVKPDEFRAASSLMGRANSDDGFKQILDLLTQISKDVKGEVTLTNDAIKEYEDWYVPFREQYRNKIDTTGVAGRIHTTILKLAIILAANDFTTIIKKDHIEESISECIGLMPNYKTFMITSGKSDYAAMAGVLIQALLDAKDHKLNRKSLLSMHWQDLDLETLEKITAKLSEAGVLKLGIEGNDINFQLTEKALKDMTGITK